MYRKILVAYNGSPESRSALDELVRLAPAPSACATRMPYTEISQISRLLYKKCSLKGSSCLLPRLGQSPR